MADTKWYGKYRSIVMDNKDPERRGRVRVQCPAVLGNYLSSWCEPCIPYAADYAGDFYVPPVNEAIWVEFEEGNVNKPIWSGGWYKVDSSPLTQDSEVTDYRFITFKNSVLRMGEKEFIFELRDNDSSYVVKVDTSTWLGLTYIGSKSEQELTDLEDIIANKTYLLETFPNEITKGLESLDVAITDVANNFNQFIDKSYNPTIEGFSAQLSAISEQLTKISNKITEIDNNLRDLQSQVDSNKSEIDSIWDTIDTLKSDINTNVNTMNDNLSEIDTIPGDILANYMTKLNNV